MYWFACDSTTILVIHIIKYFSQGNISDVSDEQQPLSLTATRRQSWLDTDVPHLLGQSISERAIQEKFVQHSTFPKKDYRAIIFRNSL